MIIKISAFFVWCACIVVCYGGILAERRAFTTSVGGFGSKAEDLFEALLYGALFGVFGPIGVLIVAHGTSNFKNGIRLLP